jgi:hypothetical protein
MMLLEVMVVAALTTVVMGVVISFMIALRQRDQSIRSFAVQCERQSELAEVLRTDIRQAADVTLPAETLLVVTAAGGGETRYELTATGCRRTVARPGRQQPGIDWFAVGPATSWTIDEGPPGSRPLLVVILKYTDSKSHTGARQLPMLVYAALGADLAPFVVKSIR